MAYNENEEEAERISKLIPLDPITEKTFRLVYSDDFIKEQGFLQEGQRHCG